MTNVWNVPMFTAAPHLSMGKDDCGRMGGCCKNSFEDLVLKTPCPMIKLVPSVKTPTTLQQHTLIPAAPRSSETGDGGCGDGKLVEHVASPSSLGHTPTCGDGCDDGKHQGKCTTTTTTTITQNSNSNNSKNNDTGKDTQDLESAKAAVLFMGIPEPVVQLVVALAPSETRLQFRTAPELFQRTQEVMEDPQMQSQLFKKLSQLRQRQSQGQGNAQGQSTAHVQGQGCHRAAQSSAGEDSPAGMSEGPLQSPATAKSAATSSAWPITATATSPADASTSSTTTFTPSSFSSSFPAAAVTGEASGELRSETAEPPPAGGDDHYHHHHHHHKEEEAREPGEESQAQDQAQASPNARDMLRKKVKALSEENWRLKKRQMCRKCRKTNLSEDGETFLPCGHFITCSACAATFDNCPACGKSIMGTVRTFLS